MKNFSTTVIEIVSVAKNTIAMKLSRPSDFFFTAGQYALLSLPALIAPDAKGAHRCMSIASAPSDDHLLFAMHIGESGFKQTIASLCVGDEVFVGSPVGQFALIDGDVRPVVFLVGGIGITPVRSILRQAIHDGDTREFFLVYSNYCIEDTTFFEELRAIPQLSYHPILTMTDADRLSQSWDGERGYITNALLKKYLPDVRAPIYYIVGTPGFTQAMTVILEKYQIP